MEIISDLAYAQIKFFNEENLVQVRWKSVPKMQLEEYQNALTLALDFQEKNSEKVKFYLSDIREQKILSPDFRKWFEKVAIPRAKKSKLKASAVIFDGNVFKKYYLNNIMNSTKKFGIPFKFFSTREDALIWLESL